MRLVKCIIYLMKYNGWLFIAGFKTNDLFYDWDLVYPGSPLNRIDKRQSVLKFAKILADKLESKFNGCTPELFTDAHSGLKESQIDAEPRIIPSISWSGDDLSEIYKDFQSVIDDVYEGFKWIVRLI